MNLTDLLKLYGDVQEHEPMSAHTTYKIGGSADQIGRAHV